LSSLGLMKNSNIRFCTEDGVNEGIATVLTATLTQREKFEAKIAAANYKKANPADDKFNEIMTQVYELETQDDNITETPLNPGLQNEGKSSLNQIKFINQSRNNISTGKLPEEINTTHNLSFREQFEAKIATAKTPEPQLIAASAAYETENNTDKDQNDELDISKQYTATLSQREKFEAKIAAASLNPTEHLPEKRYLSDISSDIDETESESHDPHSISNQTTMDIAGADDQDPLLANDQSSNENSETVDVETQNAINKAETSPPRSADEKKSRSKRSILVSPTVGRSGSGDQPNSDTSFLKKLDKKAAAVIAGGAAALGTVFATKSTSCEKTPSDEDNEDVDTVDTRKSAKSGSGRLRSRIPVKTQKSKEIEIKKSVDSSTPVGSPKEIIQPSAPPLSEVEEPNTKPTEEQSKETNGPTSPVAKPSSSPTDTDEQLIKDYQGDEPFVNMNGKLLNQISYEFSDDFSEESKPPQKDEEDQDDDDNDSGEEELIRRFTRLRKTSITETDEETGEVTQTRIEEYEEYSMVWEANDEDPVSVEEPTCISRSVSATTIISNDNDSDNMTGTTVTPDLTQKSDIIAEEDDKPPTPETTKRIKTELAEIEHCEADANKDSIEAMFYNLKKKELEQDLKMSATEKKLQSLTKQVTEDDDDIVFVNADDDEATDSFNPMEQALRRNKQFLEQLHGRKGDNSVEDEDQFDEFQPGNIRKKILASSFSKADSDFYDPTDPAVQINENNIKTALETIASTDSESSTIISAATKIQAGARGYLARKQVQSIRSSSSAQPHEASFGNAAIDQSLDDMIEQQQKQNLRMEQEAAVRIQRTYRNFLNTRRVEFSQQRPFTEDLSNHSYDDRTGGPIIEVKMEKRGAGKLSSGDRRSVDSVDSIQYEPLEETDSELKRRSKFFQSLNVDVYNTAARRQTFIRGDAIYNNSTPENDSGKSNAESTELVQKSAIAELTPDDTKAKQGNP
jgi:IQ calmodulin-binding motif